MWGLLAVGWVIKFFGTIVHLNGTGMLFAGLLEAFRYSIIFTLAFDFLIFIGYNDLFKDNFVPTTIENFDFWTLVSLQFLSYFFGMDMRKPLIVKTTEWMLPTM